MNVLLIGGPGRFINEFIIKLKKEGHRIFLLTGDAYGKEKYEKVFERYDFTYDSSNMREIFKSINPDVTIHMGAYDTNFQWVDADKDAVRYSSGLMNIMIAHSFVKKGRFIYLSSQEVYQGNYDRKLTESDAPSANDLKGITLAQNEKICLDYQKNKELDIIVLRLENLYGTPKNVWQVDNICAHMCMQALRKRYISVNSKEVISLLHEKDAIEFIYQFILHLDNRDGLYNISSSEEISVSDIALIISESLDTEINIIEEASVNGYHVLSNERFVNEFNCSAIRDTKENVKQMAGYMAKHKTKFLNPSQNDLKWWQKILNKWGWFLRACVPFIENMIVFIPFFMMNNRAVGSQYFANIDLYLIYVLIFAIIYGQHQATFSAILAVAGYLFRQTYERSGFQVMLDYNTYIWIVQLFVVGLIVGYMRDEIRKIKLESRELEQHLNVQLKDIRDINDSNVRVKDVLEQQVIDQKDSLGKIYNITSQLDKYMPSEVLFYAIEILKDILDSEDVAIYSLYGSDFARLFSASSDKARSLGNSILYKEMTPMYNEIKEHRVYVNRELDARYPLMANAIYENDNVKLIIMVWGIPWEKMTLAQANLLVIVSYLIQNAVLRANRYMEALEDKRYREGTVILEEEAFETLIDAYVNAQEKNLAQCSVIRVNADPKKYAEIAEILMEKLRDTDYIGTRKDGGLYALLANTSSEVAGKVVERLSKSGYRGEVLEKYQI